MVNKTSQRNLLFMITLIITILLLMATSFILSPMANRENGYTSWYEKSEPINRCSYNDERAKPVPYRYDFGVDDDIYPQQDWHEPIEYSEYPIYVEDEAIFYVDECEYRMF